MKSYKIGVILLFLLVFSIGAVCAEDAGNATLSSTDGDLMSADDKTYEDLSNLINSSSSATIEIKDDYTFNTITDTKKNILIENSEIDYVFNGNNHVIDASGSAGLFKIVNSTVTLKDLVIRNCNSTPIVAVGSALNTINVTFENNWDMSTGGAIYAEESVITSNGDKFTDNCAKEGSSVYLVYSKFDAKNDLFENNLPVDWARYTVQTVR